MVFAKDDRDFFDDSRTYTVVLHHDHALPASLIAFTSINFNASECGVQFADFELCTRIIAYMRQPEPTPFATLFKRSLRDNTEYLSWAYEQLDDELDQSDAQLLDLQLVGAPRPCIRGLVIPEREELDVALHPFRANETTAGAAYSLIRSIFENGVDEVSRADLRSEWQERNTHILFGASQLGVSAL